MRLREPYVRKHICIFTLSFSDWHNNQLQYVERTCDECGKKQYAYVLRDEWPESIWHLADVDWTTGSGEDDD